MALLGEWGEGGVGIGGGIGVGVNCSPSDKDYFLRLSDPGLH